jgi:hypothetical protein
MHATPFLLWLNAAAVAGASSSISIHFLMITASKNTHTTVIVDALSRALAILAAITLLLMFYEIYLEMRSQVFVAKLNAVHDVSFK